jgi:predicted nucleic acid-binding protein
MNKSIQARQTHKIKLADAIIAATALCSGIESLTLDQHLLSVARSAAKLTCAN